MIPIFFIVLPIKSFYKHSKNLPILHRSFSQFSVQFTAAFLCGLHCRRLCRAVGMGRVSGRGKVVSRSTTRFGGSTLASSSLFPTSSSRHSPLQRPHLQYTFHQLLLSLSFSVISLFFYPSSCSSLPVRVASVFRSVACSLLARVAMQFHVQLLQSSCVGCRCVPFIPDLRLRRLSFEYPGSAGAGPRHPTMAREQ